MRMRNRIKDMMRRIMAKTEGAARKRGMEAIEKAIMVVVGLAVSIIFKDQIIEVTKTIWEYVSTTATTMFTI